MNHRELQALESGLRRNIGGEIAALEHVATGVERYTTLPTSELHKDIDVLKIEGKLAENLDSAQTKLLGAIRAARLLNKTDAAEEIGKAFKGVTDIQADLARERGEE